MNTKDTNPEAWKQATREVDLLINSSKAMMKFASEVNISPALQVDYDAKVGVKPLNSYTFESKPLEWQREPDQHRALDREADYIKEIDAHHKALDKDVKKTFAAEFEQPRTFDVIIKKGPKDIQEHTMLQAAHAFLAPQEIKVAMEDKKSPQEMQTMIQGGQQRMGTFVQSINAEREKRMSASQNVTVVRHESLSEFSEIDGPLEQLKKLNHLAREVQVAGKSLRSAMASEVDVGQATPSLPGRGQGMGF